MYTLALLGIHEQTDTHVRILARANNKPVWLLFEGETLIKAQDGILFSYFAMLDSLDSVDATTVLLYNVHLHGKMENDTITPTSWTWNTFRGRHTQSMMKAS